jgi:uncharacterized protein YceK
MRTWRIPAAGVAVAILVLSGCGPIGSDPMPTDGPNQVVYSVPGMT